jgi:hypothetical protein
MLAFRRRLFKHHEEHVLLVIDHHIAVADADKSERCRHWQPLASLTGDVPSCTQPRGNVRSCVLPCSRVDLVRRGRQT